MLMSELCRQCGVTKDTVRYYHRIGLLMPPLINATNRYGIYDESHRERLRYIKKLQSFGFLLREVKSAILLEENQSLSDEMRIATLEQKLGEVDTKIEELSDYKESLLNAMVHLKKRLAASR